MLISKPIKSLPMATIIPICLTLAIASLHLDYKSSMKSPLKKHILLSHTEQPQPPHDQNK